MTITLNAVRATDEDDVIAFLATHRWPYHVESELSVDTVRARLAAGWLRGPGTEAYWIVADDRRTGLVRVVDLDDGTPLIDLRLATEARGRGIGTLALQLVTQTVFERHPAVRRIEGTTRVDNHAMRRVFEATGWVLESHWRRSWPAEHGEWRDGVGYGVLRDDVENGRVTPVRWDD